jgi:hypothetical protein
MKSWSKVQPYLVKFIIWKRAKGSHFQIKTRVQVLFMATTIISKATQLIDPHISISTTIKYTNAKFL